VVAVMRKWIFSRTR